jgi:hypothetical protein
MQAHALHAAPAPLANMSQLSVLQQATSPALAVQLEVSVQIKLLQT